MHATKEAVAECSSPSSSSSNSAHNPVVPLRDTSTKVHSGVDAEKCIVNFYNELGNATKLKDFLETSSPDEPTEMHGSVRDITRSAYRACKSEAEMRQKTCQTTVLDTIAIFDSVGPALANSMPPWYFDPRERHARSLDDERCLGAHVCRLNIFLD